VTLELWNIDGDSVAKRTLCGVCGSRGVIVVSLRRSQNKERISKYISLFIVIS
jgi:hypothetical protein